MIRPRSTGRIPAGPHAGRGLARERRAVSWGVDRPPVDEPGPVPSGLSVVGEAAFQGLGGLVAEGAADVAECLLLGAGCVAVGVRGVAEDDVAAPDQPRGVAARDLHAFAARARPRGARGG